MSNGLPVLVKPEPRDVPLTSLSQMSFPPSNNVPLFPFKTEAGDAARAFLGLPANHNAAHSNHLPKHEDVHMEDAYIQDEEPAPILFKVFQSASDIAYAPEEALKAGLDMVSGIQEVLKKIQLSSKMRQEVWMREIETLRSQGAPRTLIAVCGATGAGKSSILNAVLDDNIVPTSGMRACTAVVTELAYHDKPTIEADVSFLSELEWRQEMTILLQDLVDEDGNIKRSTDLKSDAGIAWQKVHAVYPSITQEQLVKMSVDQVINQDPRVSRILGETKKISAKDSKTFAKEIGKYIDSKDQKRKEKKSKKDKPAEKSLMDKVREAAGSSRATKEKQPESDAPALWPLIRQVNVRCRAAALSTGAVLVDLPGVADANAARNNIAKDYMKKCNCIWILAPITRAVDDKTARDLLGDAFKMQLMMDGNYDDHTITFIASKCDDISCSEVIRALRLEDDPELEAIEERLDGINGEKAEWEKKKKAAEKLAKGIDTELQDLRNHLREYNAHLEALENGDTFVPTLTGKGASGNGSSSKKRKNHGKGKAGSPKRRRSGLSDDDDDFSDDDSSTAESIDSDDESESDQDEDLGSDTGDVGVDEEQETEDSLKEKITESKNAIKDARERLSSARKQKKDASDHLSILSKNVAKVQREKNAFCSLKRSEFSRDVLKEDFRVGLKDLDDAAAEERDPENFNPNANLRDYDAIDLPVFTCSSRDYVRLKGQVQGDGEASCFTNVNDTGVPDLQRWCHQLTVSSRERAARNFLSHLNAFAKSIQTYVEGAADVTTGDREALREKWESTPLAQHGIAQAMAWDGAGDAFDAILGGLGGGLGAGLFTMNQPASLNSSKVDRESNRVGIAPRLCTEFAKTVDNCVQELQENFKSGLEEKCRVGAANAAEAAVPTTDEFAASMHWATYRATLRRHGSWRRDFNVELVNPFTRNIAHSWSTVFESNLFAPFETATLDSINKLLKDVEDSAAPGLKDRTNKQAEVCLEEARVALKNAVELVKQTLATEQKEVSRCIAPHVQAQLIEGYNTAMEERGTGSVARQKAYFRRYIDECKDNIFDDGADVLLGRLTKAADAIGETLDDALGKLAEKIEVSLAVLWEGVGDDPAQAKCRRRVVEIVSSIQEQVKLWNLASKLKHDGIDADGDMVIPDPYDSSF